VELVGRNPEAKQPGFDSAGSAIKPTQVAVIKRVGADVKSMFQSGGRSVAFASA
jgi:hypothetical protein